jgi:DNA-binding MarR family transcriptional regulator
VSSSGDGSGRASEHDIVWAMSVLDQRQYERLLRFRTGLRRFLRWSAEQAALAGLTPAQHQLLLAVRGHPDPQGPTVRDVAGYLFLRHHSAVELIDRAQAAGLVERRTDPTDGRAVRLGLTASGEERLDQLAAAHLEELARLERELHALWDGLGTTVDDTRAGNT